MERSSLRELECFKINEDFIDIKFVLFWSFKTFSIGNEADTSASVIEIHIYLQ